MKLKGLIDTGLFEIVNQGEDLDREISKPFCCDLLSFAMGKAPQDGAWVTVMGNINTIAVADLADISCIIIAEGAHFDDAALAKAKATGMCVLSSEEPIFETAEKVMRLLQC